MGKTLDKTSIMNDLVKIAQEIHGNDINMNNHTILTDIGFDSMDSREYSMCVEEKYEVDLEQMEKEPNNLWYLNKTIEGMANYIIKESK